MTCHDVQELLSAWLDRECARHEREELEAHLQACASCRTIADALAAQDRHLRQALHEDRAAAQRVTAHVIQALSTSGRSVMSARSLRVARRGWWMLAWGVAAGFLLALVVPGLRRGEPPAQAPAAGASTPPAAIAQLVTSTGEVELFDPRQAAWLRCPDVLPVTVNPSSRVRTADNVKCELETKDGCVIRLNDQTEITLTGSSSIELAKGQVWCRTPQEVSLEVRVDPDAGGQKRPDAASEAPLLKSKGPSCVVTGIREQGHVQIVSTAGHVLLELPWGERSLETGEIVEIAEGKLQTRSIEDPLLWDRWIHPLLVQKGPGNAELEQRVNQMLAQIGKTKMTILYEQEIRALGEYGVLPLIRYVRSPLSEREGQQRLAAMKLAADLAPVWLIGDFIALLEDSDARIRVLAAETLERLTGQTMNTSPQDWQRDPSTLAAPIARWQSWWQTNRHRHSSPTVRITKE